MTPRNKSTLPARQRKAGAHQDGARRPETDSGCYGTGVHCDGCHACEVEASALEWHKKSAGRYRTTIRRNGWVEVYRHRDGKWHIVGVCWPVPKYIIAIGARHATMRDAKCAAEAHVEKYRGPACSGEGLGG
jgi:hypothetical protein